MEGQVCVFFGHKECSLDAEALRNVIEGLIGQGVEHFLVGHQGRFDGMVRKCLKSLQEQYPHIHYSVVLAYLPTERQEYEDYTDTMYPEGIESVHPKYAIDWRNRYLVEAADICVCYIDHTWGGAYKFVRLAKKQGKRIINFGNPNIKL